MFSFSEGKPLLVDVNSGGRAFVVPFDAGRREFHGADLSKKHHLLLDNKPNQSELDEMISDSVNLQRLVHTPGANWVPLLGKTGPDGKKVWDGHIFVCGSTGAGKSWIVKTMLQNEEKTKRKFFLITDLDSEDPSFAELFRSGRLKKVRKVARRPTEVTIDAMKEHVEKNKPAVIIFDDISPSNKMAHVFRDRVLEKGRHRNVTAIVVSHKMRDNQMTKTPLNDSQFIVCFPNSNRAQIMSFMKDVLDLPAWKRRRIMDLAQREGRHMILHLWNPNFVATGESLIML